MTVEQLIEELKTYPPDAIVTYAFGEYNGNAIHDFISEEMILVDSNNEPVYFDREIITCLPEDVHDLVDEVQDLLTIPGNKWQSAIKLFSQ